MHTEGKAIRWVHGLTALLCAVLIAPILIVVALSFSDEALLQFPPRAWSLRWYAEFFVDARWRSALVNSLVIGLGACLIATSVGFLAAYALVRANMGVAVVDPFYLLGDGIDKQGLRTVPFAPCIAVKAQLLLPSNTALSRQAQRFVSVLSDTAAALKTRVPGHAEKPR